MKILGIEASSLVASVAVLDGDVITAEYTVNYKKTHSQTLMPMLAAIAEMTELDLDTLDAIAVSRGPGSFTGLRIGRPRPRAWDWHWISRWWRCPLWTPRPGSWAFASI